MDYQTISGALTVFFWKVVPGAVGSFIAIWLKKENVSHAQAFVSWVIGGVISIFITPLIMSIYHINAERAELGVGLLVGSFGLTIMRKIFGEINNTDFLGALKRRLIGMGDKP